MSTEVLLNEFKEYSEHPHRVLSQYKQEGKKVIGVLPYYAPVELVVAAGMVPMGIWGSNKKTIALAKEYCATFYCTIGQLALEMLLDGTLDQLDGIITPTICDTLRPMSQNYRVAMEGKLPCIFLAHPQNRKPAFGLQFTVDQYMHVKGELEKIAGKTITDDDLRAAIKVMNRNRAARRAFVKLASEHCDVISAVKRSAVLRAAWFMEPDVYAEKLEALNEELSKLPAADWKGCKIVTSGIICDGAKASCAAKIASAVEAGLLGWKMQQHHSQFYGGDGIVVKGVENTIRNVGTLASEGMRETDRTIIRLMTSGMC